MPVSQDLRRHTLLLQHNHQRFSSQFSIAIPVFRYASDCAYNGYKSLCQHKLLQCIGIEPLLSRTYPPSMLEWKANRRRAHMAVEVKFADGEFSILTWEKCNMKIVNLQLSLVSMTYNIECFSFIYWLEHRGSIWKTLQLCATAWGFKMGAFSNNHRLSSMQVLSPAVPLIPG
jgi:hypothetical protein